MDSGSDPANSADPPPHKLADFVGTLIAVLTLTLPLFIIAHYSSSKAEVLQPAPYTLRVSQD